MKDNRNGGVKIDIKNRRARFDYFVEDEYVAGIALLGGEIKSIRNGNASIGEAFCYVSPEGEMMLKGSYIKLYENAGYAKYDERRPRKLLLKKAEIRKIARFMKEHRTGYTIVPLSMFINEKGYCKVRIGVCRGKKNYDKRESVKERDMDRQTKREI